MTEYSDDEFIELMDRYNGPLSEYHRQNFLRLNRENPARAAQMVATLKLFSPEEYRRVAERHERNAAEQRAAEDAEMIRTFHELGISAALGYDEYIKSDLWKERAAQARKRAGHRCQVCNTNNARLHVHHRTYERLGHEDDMDLTVLCENCHRLFHQHGKLKTE